MDLDTFPHEVEGEHGCFGEDACKHAGGGITTTPGHMQAFERYPKRLICGKEDAHEGDDLAKAWANATEEPSPSLIALDLPDCATQGPVNSMTALCSKTCAEEIEGVCKARSGGAGGGAGNEALGGIGEAVLEGILEEKGGGTVGGKLYGGVADIHQLGRDVALPKSGDALMLDDVLEGCESAAISRCVAEGEEGIGEGVRLELKADLDDVERRDDEAADRVVSLWC